jgi:hypothetical protein
VWIVFVAELALSKGRPRLTSAMFASLAATKIYLAKQHVNYVRLADTLDILGLCMVAWKTDQTTRQTSFALVVHLGSTLM